MSLSAIAAGPLKVARATTTAMTTTRRLATTPLYFITNTRGNAYLQEDNQSGQPEQKIVIYFMSSEDAKDYLEEMSQINAGQASEIRITTTSMEKVVNQIISRKQSRKLGRYDMEMIYRIQPSSRQCDNAERVLGKSSALQGLTIPMFCAEGLTIKRANGELVTPYYFSYEDLQEDWSKLRMSTSEVGVPDTPKVSVKDFTDVMCLSAGITKSLLSSEASSSDPMSVLEQVARYERDGSGKVGISKAGVVPPRAEIDMIKQFYRNNKAASGLKGEYSKAKILQQR
jgi:hypothetical protein